MKQFSKRYLKPEDWTFKGNPLAGTEWTVSGSKAGTSYTVALTEQGFSCSCTGFQFHGKCKHSMEVIGRFDD